MSNRRGFFAGIVTALLVGMLAFGGSTADAQVAQPARETILLADDFDDPTQGKLRISDTASFYESGEYVLMKVGPYLSIAPTTRLPGRTYGDASIAVDVRLAGETAGRTVGVGCRLTPPGDRVGGYRLVLDPTDGRLALIRLAEGTAVPLVDWRPSSAIRTGEQSNRLELSCSGSTIKGTVNGVELASLEDRTYAGGQMEIAANLFLPGSMLTVEARFDNLVVRNEPTAEPGLGNALLADGFDDRLRGMWLPALDVLRVYDSGEYVMKKLSKWSGVVPTVRLPGAYAVASVAVDARLVGETADRRVTVGCRMSPLAGRVDGYRLSVDPSAGTFAVVRLVEGVSLVVRGWEGSAAIRPGNQSNRLELSCAGAVITASVNGVALASVEDDSLEEGEMSIGAESLPRGRAYPPVEARFDNLVVTASEPRGAPVPAPAQVPKP